MPCNTDQAGTCVRDLRFGPWVEKIPEEMAYYSIFGLVFAAMSMMSQRATYATPLNSIVITLQRTSNYLSVTLNKLKWKRKREKGDTALSVLSVIFGSSMICEQSGSLAGPEFTR